MRTLLLAQQMSVHKCSNVFQSSPTASHYAIAFNWSIGWAYSTHKKNRRAYEILVQNSCNKKELWEMYISWGEKLNVLKKNMWDPCSIISVTQPNKIFRTYETDFFFKRYNLDQLQKNNWPRIYRSLRMYLEGCDIAQAFSRRRPTATAPVWAQVRSCETCGGHSGTRAVFLRVLWFPLANSHSTNCSTFIIIYHPEPVQ
jgi:hypothetical protein